jgi:hypothetical protein
MAHIDTDEIFPLWLAETLSDDIWSGSTVPLLGLDLDSPEVNPPYASASVSGYIIRGWFGPFLLGPPTRSLRGKC